MTTYTIIFFKHLVNDVGQPFKAMQDTIKVPADSKERAVSVAKRKFACARGIPDWELHADGFEISASPRRSNAKRWRLAT